jgi:hypothetical protein
MKRALLLVALLALPWPEAAASKESSPSSRGRPQVLVVDVAVLRHEFEKGWPHSLYVRLGDTYASFVNHQLDDLLQGKYIDLMPEVKSQVEAIERSSSRPGSSLRSGGWEPIGWGECDHDLILLVRRNGSR